MDSEANGVDPLNATTFVPKAQPIAFENCRY